MQTPEKKTGAGSTGARLLLAGQIVQARDALLARYPDRAALARAHERYLKQVSPSTFYNVVLARNSAVVLHLLLHAPQLEEVLGALTAQAVAPAQPEEPVPAPGERAEAHRLARQRRTTPTPPPGGARWKATCASRSPPAVEAEPPVVQAEPKTEAPPKPPRVAGPEFADATPAAPLAPDPKDPQEEAEAQWLAFFRQQTGKPISAYSAEFKGDTVLLTLRPVPQRGDRWVDDRGRVAIIMEDGSGVLLDGPLAGTRAEINGRWKLHKAH